MSRDVVLIISDKGEHSVPKITGHLSQMGQDFCVLNVGSFLESHTKMSLSIKSGILFGNISCHDGSELDLERVKSIWFRRPRNVFVDIDLPDLEKRFIEDEVLSSMWSLYTCLDDVFWMNHPLNAKYLLEHNKLFQLKLAVASGLVIPRTIVTNNPDQLEDFCRSCGNSIAVKAIRSRIFQHDDGTATGIYTNKVGTDEIQKNRKSILLAPLMAQEYVAKRLELRITIVGETAHTCAIYSQDSERTKDDWRRYDFDKVRHEKFDLPDEIKTNLFKLMRKCNLTFGAVDMVLTPDGEYVFLEVNPSGQFGWIENLTGLPISQSIAEILVRCA